GAELCNGDCHLQVIGSGAGNVAWCRLRCWLAGASLIDKLSPLRGDTAPRFRGRAPDTFQLGAILPFSAFLACRKINKFRTPDMVSRKCVRFLPPDGRPQLNKCMRS